MKKVERLLLHQDIDELEAEIAKAARAPDPDTELVDRLSRDLTRLRGRLHAGQRHEREASIEHKAIRWTI